MRRFLIRRLVFLPVGSSCVEICTTSVMIVASSCVLCESCIRDLQLEKSAEKLGLTSDRSQQMVPRSLALQPCINLHD